MAPRRHLSEEQVEKAYVLRTKNGLSMDDLAQRFGVSTKTLSRVICDYKAKIVGKG